MDDHQRPPRWLQETVLLVGLLVFLTALIAIDPGDGGLIAFIAGLCLLFAFLRNRTSGSSNKKRLWIAVAIIATGAIAFIASRFRSEASIITTSEDPSALTEVCHAPRPTIVIFSAEWCGYCKQLEEKTLTDPQVKKRLEKYAVEIVDVDRNKALARKAHVTGIPTVFALSPSCKTVDTLDGYVTPEAFLAWLDKVEKHQ